MNCIDKVLTDEEINNLVNEIMNIPIEKNNNCLSTYGSVNVDDLISNVKEFKKIPTFDSLLKENKQLKGSLQTHEILLKANVEENQKLKEQLQNKQDIINGILDYIDSNKFVEEFENVVNERNVRNEILMIIEKSDK